MEYAVGVLVSGLRQSTGDSVDFSVIMPYSCAQLIGLGDSHRGADKRVLPSIGKPVIPETRQNRAVYP